MLYEDRLVVPKVLGQNSSAVSWNYLTFTRNSGVICPMLQAGILGVFEISHTIKSFRSSTDRYRSYCDRKGLSRRCIAFLLRRSHFIDQNVRPYPRVWLSTDVKSVSFPFPVSRDNEVDANPKLLAAMMSAAGQYDPHIRNAILRLRGAVVDHRLKNNKVNSYHPKAVGQHKIIALTNNFGQVEVSNEEAAFLGWKDGPTPNHLRQLFHDFCDSSTHGMRSARV